MALTALIQARLPAMRHRDEMQFRKCDIWLFEALSVLKLHAVDLAPAVIKPPGQISTDSRQSTYPSMPTASQGQSILDHSANSSGQG
jgi:hypothetical protein